MKTFVAKTTKPNTKAYCWNGYRVKSLALLLLALPAMVQAQFTFTTNNGTITITAYTGPGGAVTIPDETNGFPVTVIAGGKGAFSHSGITGIVIPSSITNIGDEAFLACTNLASITIPESVISIGDEAFNHCTSLTNIIFPGVSRIGIAAFYYCISLSSIRMPESVASIEDEAFLACTNLSGVFFKGNAPSVGSSVFDSDSHGTIYYLPGTTNWGSTFGGRPTVLWNPQIQVMSCQIVFERILTSSSTVQT